MRSSLLSLFFLSLFIRGITFPESEGFFDLTELEDEAFAKDYDSFCSDRTIPEKERLYIKRFLLPETSSAKSVLDILFTDSRSIFDEEHFLDAGFVPLHRIRKDKILIARHPLLQGFIVKTYLDKYPVNKKGAPDWLWLARRCILAEKIKKIIKKKHIKNFTVPKKWLYPTPSAPTDDYRLNSLLIEEEMPLVSIEDNLIAWKNISHDALDELADIILEAGGSSYRPDNMWMTYDGTFAFIDTEYPHLTQRLSDITRYLSEKNKKYWTCLIMGKILIQKP